MDPADPTTRPCPICGGTSYAWGDATAHGLAFTPADASLLRKAFRFGTRLPARRCDGCGNVQLFAAPPAGRA